MICGKIAKGEVCNQNTSFFLVQFAFEALAVVSSGIQLE